MKRQPYRPNVHLVHCLRRIKISSGVVFWDWSGCLFWTRFGAGAPRVQQNVKVPGLHFGFSTSRSHWRLPKRSNSWMVSPKYLNIAGGIFLMTSGTWGRGFESSRKARSCCCDRSGDSVALLSASPGRLLNWVGEKSPTGPSAKSILSPSEVGIKLPWFCVSGKDGENEE